MSASSYNYKEADNHIAYWKGKTPIERPNAACFIINTIFGITPKSKINKAVTTRRSTEMAELFDEGLIDFLSSLHYHDVNYLLVGGYAVILHGYVRSTSDMDGET